MKITESTVVAAPVDDVWGVAGDPLSLAAWVPGVEEVWLDGDVRHVRLTGGAEAGERLTHRDEAARYYEYEWAFGPMPVRTYMARLSVSPHASGTEVFWVGDVTGDSPELDAQLAEGLRASYEGGLAALRALPAFT